MGKINIKKSVYNLSALSIFTALAITLSILEGLIPMPFLPPFMKLGLSNIAVMLAAVNISSPAALLIAVLKGIFAAFTRGVTAGIMSLAGGVISSLLMAVLLRSKKQPFGMIGIGIIGGCSHNIGQLAVAALLSSPAVFSFTPFLLIIGGLSGALTGVVLWILLPVIEKLSFYKIY